ncbi:MAG: hypothetical protein WD045_01045 [Pirellulaceae bacterium]
MTWKSITATLIGSLLIATVVAGCRPTPKPRPAGGTRRSSENIGVTRADRQLIQQAIGFLEDQDRFLPDRVKEESLQRLNRWLAQKKLDPQWQPDPMVAELNAEFRDQPRLQKLATRMLADSRLPDDATTFRGSEFDYIQGAYWCKQVSDLIARQARSNSAFRDWLARAHADFDANNRNDLDVASRLFDWTVRNIHPVRPHRMVEERFSPGTSRDVWATIQTGEGDPWERARVFMHLARQQGLPGVILSLGSENSSAAEHLLVGILVREELFLFDPTYGLPVSDEKGEGVASLSRLQSDPSLLTEMASPNYRYPIGEADLKEIRVWLDAPSTSLTQASAAIEAELAAENKMVLHYEPSKVKALLEDLEGIQSVGLWTVPYQAEMAVATFYEDTELRTLLLTERWMFDNTSPLAQARFQELAGRLQDEIQNPGARSLYLAARRMERELAMLTPREMVRQLEATGMQFPADPKAAEFQLMQVQRSAVLWKERASLQLGVIALGSEEYRSAIDYFQKRVLDEFPQTEFKSTAFYGLGRAYEGLGMELEDAEELNRSIGFYTSDDDLLSPYRRGNAVRAKRLGRLLSPEATDAPASEIPASVDEAVQEEETVPKSPSTESEPSDAAEPAESPAVSQTEPNGEENPPADNE